MALAVGPDVQYVRVKDGENEYILAEARFSAYYSDSESCEILGRMTGADLVGAKYEPLFPYFANLANDGAFRIISADYVTTADGTGIVHIAPGFGEDDAAAAKEHGFPEVCPVDNECKFTNDISDYAGRYVKEVDKEIIRRLKDEGTLVHRGVIKHNYPHCWRDDAPLIYRAISTWFVNIEPIKEKMIAANKKINWVPSHIRDGRFGKWLENARDWSISRNRYWGNPLPIWRNDAGESICVGSVRELEELTGETITDIHKHFVDELEIPSPTGGEPLKRIPEVLDCWFESGSMPYAQKHYPFENNGEFESHFPADFIAEGLDQTRGWFYTLVVLGAALFDKPPFSNVVVNGLILAEDGQKMSKRKKNYPDPSLVFDTLGADSLRLFLLGSPVVRGEDLKFSENAIKDVLRSVLIPIWNAYSFFITYANLDKWEPTTGQPTPPDNPSNPLDRWILSSLSQMISEIRENMDGYHLQKAANRFEKFVGDLTNWYIRRSRRRFWKSQNDSEKSDAYTTLHFILIRFCQTAAPFIPFITEEMYRNLRTSEMPESVHLCDYPEADPSSRDEKLERQMDLTMNTVSLGRFLRAQRSLRVRQPLSRVLIVAAAAEDRELLKETADIIAEELNVKKIDVNEDDSELVTLSVKANFKSLGPKLGKNMKTAAAAIAKLDGEKIKAILNDKEITLEFPEIGELIITSEDIIVQREERPGMCVTTDNNLTLALDANLTDALKREGIAREFVSRIQNIRKDAGFEVSDRIDIFYDAKASEIVQAVKEFSDYIRNETLAIDITLDSDLADGYDGIQKVEINDANVLLILKKRNQGVSQT
jgi:isoleucyl-tRNA synthetase